MVIKELLRRSKAPMLRFWHLVKFPLLIGVLLGLLVSNVIISTNQAKEAKEAERRAIEADQRAQISREQLEDLILCIVQFYRKPVRAGVYLKSVEDCRYERRKTSNPTKDRVAKSADPSPSPPPSQLSSPTPTVRRAPTRPRTEDKSFLECLPVDTRKLLNGILPKDSILRNLSCK